MTDDPNARNTDPFTSKLAAADIRAEKAADRAQVFASFFGHHPTPLAHFQIDALLGGDQNGRWRKRCGDLKDEGVIVPVDTIINPRTMKEVIRWGLKDASRPLGPKPSRQKKSRPSTERTLLTLMGVR